MPYLWLYTALSAAVCWGFGYAVAERVMKMGVPPPFMLIISGFTSFFCYLIISLYSGKFWVGSKVMTGDLRTFFMCVMFGLTVVIGNYLIFISIAQKNAALVNMIEIAYPLFTFLFAWLLFRDVQLNWATAIGGFLIFCGVGVIYWKS